MPETPEVTFVMPPVTLGQDVCWHMGGSRSSQPSLAKVCKVTPTLVEVWNLQDGDWVRISSVRHIDDPFLRQNPAWARHGAWDYTPYEKQLRARFEAIETRLDALEAPAKQEADKSNELQRLRGELGLAGVKWQHNWGLAKLKQELEAAQAPA